MSEKLPWEDPAVRDEQKMISLYLPEVIKIKLKWLSEQTGVPQQKIMRRILLPSIEEQVKEEMKKQGLEEKGAKKK